MKKILLAAFALTGLTAGAQQVQGDFDAEWGNCIPYTYENASSDSPMNKECGEEPIGWHSANVLGMGPKKSGGNWMGTTIVVEKTTEENGYSVKLTNTPNPYRKSEIVPGYITLGTPWNTAKAKSSTTEEADGGSFGGIDFAFVPDAVAFQYKRSVADATSDQPASVIAYLWKGTYTQADVPVTIYAGDALVGFVTTDTPKKISMEDRDRNIMGITSTTTGGDVTSSNGAGRIAKLEYSISETNTEWKDCVVPFNYESTDKPEKLNIIFSAGDYFGDKANLVSGNALEIDNVRLVYYHALQDVSYNGTALTFDASNYCDLSSVDYDATKTLTYTKVGVGATVEDPVYDEQTCQLTVTVKGNDFEANAESYTTYTIQFAKPVDVTNVVGAYASELGIAMGEGSDPTFAPGVRVSLTEGTKPGTVNFELRDFDMGDGTMLGDIVLPNIRLIDKGNNTYGFGENAPVHLTLLEGKIKATATLNIETSSVEGDNLTAHVDVIWLDDDGITPIMPIYVSAIGPKIYPLTITDGEAINAQAGAYDVTLTRSFAKGWSTLCLPFDVNPAEFGVEGVKVQEFSAATGNSLDFKTVETITANVPCLIYFPEAVNAGVTFLTKTIASLDAQAVQKGEYTFKGSYEGSISMSGKYGVADVNGVQKIMRGGSSSTLKCTRAYFEYNGTDNVQGMRLNLEGGNVTGIDGITTGDTDAGMPLYDLSGRRVQNATKGGIYIRNGKKIIK